MGVKTSHFLDAIGERHMSVRFLIHQSTDPDLLMYGPPDQRGVLSAKNLQRRHDGQTS